MLRRGAILAAGAIVLSVAVPAPAIAGTATVVDDVQGRGSDPVQYVRYKGAPGEANRVTARLNPGAPVTASISDSAGVVAGRGCSRPNASNRTFVVCRLGGATSHGATSLAAANAFEFVLGDGDDAAKIVGGDTSGRFDGGAGNDVLRAGRGLPSDEDDASLPTGATLRGGRGDDRLYGGPGDDILDETGPTADGSDTLRGGTGSDQVTYEGRRAPVRADLAGDRDDGSRGERDLIAGIEFLEGGDAGDRLTGNRVDNILEGGGGSDYLSGGRGRDDLFAVDAEGSLDKRRTRDRLAGGPGGDSIEGSERNDRIDPGPGSDRVDAGGGADRVRARDRSTDNVTCGRGRDSVAIDSSDFAGQDCERIRRRGTARAVYTGSDLLDQLGSSRRSSTSAVIGCSSDLPSPCRITVTLTRRGRILARSRGRIGRGASTEIFLNLNSAGRRLSRRGGGVRLVVRTRVGRSVRTRHYALTLERCCP